ncbi:hypothetical protein HRG_014486 [Hirsutella rhossiliensis]
MHLQRSNLMGKAKEAQADESGDTWSIATALEASETDPWYFRCNITVGPVANAGQTPVSIYPGRVPIRGISLEILGWNKIHYILGLTVGFQLFLAVVSVLVANRIQVRHGSHLAMATLLRPVLRGVCDGASAANGREVGAMLGPDAMPSYVPA